MIHHCVQTIWCTFYGIRCTAPCTVCGARCTVYGVRCTVHGVRCAAHGVQCTACGAPYTMYGVGVRCMMYGLRCAVLYTVYGMRCTVYGVRCAVHGTRHASRSAQPRNSHGRFGAHCASYARSGQVARGVNSLMWNVRSHIESIPTSQHIVCNSACHEDGN